MMEDVKNHLLGRVKLIIGREFPDQEWTVIHYRIWSDQFDYDDGYRGNEDYLLDVIHMSDLNEDYNAAVAKITGSEESVGVFEIIAEVRGEFWKSWTDYGYEYDAREWIENEKTQKLEGDRLKWFQEEQHEAWLNYYGEEEEDVSNKRAD